MAKPRNNRRLVGNALIARRRPCDPWGGRLARGAEGYVPLARAAKPKSHFAPRLPGRRTEARGGPAEREAAPRGRWPSRWLPQSAFGRCVASGL